MISEFLGKYEKEYGFFEATCKIVAGILEDNLQSAGIRAIVSFRAKNPGRLEAKVVERAQKKNYHKIESIYDDIVDLAGVHVALYFPGQREEVGNIIQKHFLLASEPKNFPENPLPRQGRRFSGYWATHYRVRIPQTCLSKTQRKHAGITVEIQVASVLMHAWSEVEHDLVYKPLQGGLSEEEYAVLDELNGLVLAGEIALERLQHAGEHRASTKGREFASHYDLAAALLELAHETLGATALTEREIGRVDLLFLLLMHDDINTPEALTPYLDALHDDFEKRPLAEQVIDQLLAESPERYATFARLRADDFHPDFAPEHIELPAQSRDIGIFMSLWIEYEQCVRTLAESKGLSGFSVTPSKLLPGISPAPKNCVSSGTIWSTASKFRIAKRSVPPRPNCEPCSENSKKPMQKRRNTKMTDSASYRERKATTGFSMERKTERLASASRPDSRQPPR